MNRFNEIKRIMDTSPEFAIQKRLHLFDLTRNVYILNHNELINILENLSDTININNNHYTIVIEITRKFINLVGSAFLFAEFMMRENKRLAENGIPGYSDMVNSTFKESPNTQFVKQLRNYVIHSDMLDINLKTIIKPHQEYEKTFAILKTDKLLSNKEWNSFSKKYIRDNAPDIDLHKCIVEYSKTQESFYTWFGERYSEKFRREISYAETITSEWNDLITKIKNKIEKMSFKE